MHSKSYHYVYFESTYDCSFVWLYDVGKILTFNVHCYCIKSGIRFILGFKIFQSCTYNSSKRADCIHFMSLCLLHKNINIKLFMPN